MRSLLCLIIIILSCIANAIPKLVVVIVPDATLNEAYEITAPLSIERQYSISWIVGRTRRLPMQMEGNGAANMLTIAAGGQVAASDEFETAPARPDWASQWQSLIKSHHGIDAWGQIGQLADIIHSNGIKTAVIGNSDLPYHPIRYGRLLASDSSGNVDNDMSALPPAQNPQSPYGLQSNLLTIEDSYIEASRHCQFIVIEIGDILRADRYEPMCTPEQAQIMRRMAVIRTKQIVDRLQGRFQRLILLAPQSGFQPERNRIFPLIIATNKIANSKSLLTSNNTYIQGLITNSDLTPTILQAMELNLPKNLIGQPAIEKQSSNPIQTLEDLKAKWEWQSSAWTAWIGLSLFCIFTIVAGYWLWRRTRNMIWLQTASYLCIMRLLIPAILDVAPGAVWSNIMMLTGYFIALALIFAGKSPVPYCLIALMFLVDWALGGLISGRAAWGPNPAHGIRFYGVGNHSAAVGLGVILLAGAMILRRNPSARWIVLTLVLVFPLLMLRGVNACIALAGLASFVTGWWLLFPSKLSRWLIAIAAVALMILLIAFAPGHISRIISLGSDPLLRTVIGKFHTNMRVLFSEWGLLLLTGLFAARYFELRSPKPSNSVRSWLTAWNIALLVVFLIEDIGAIMVALMLIFRFALSIQLFTPFTERIKHRRELNQGRL